jgi:hypothetical protein
VYEAGSRRECGGLVIAELVAAAEECSTLEQVSFITIHLADTSTGTLTVRVRKTPIATVGYTNTIALAL